MAPMVIFRQKLRVVKLLISLGLFLCDCFVRMAIRVLGRKPEATCVILYYHSVPNAQKQAFANQMDVVARLTMPISIDLVSRMLPGTRYSSITFDDGFEDIITNAIPELQQRGIFGTVFLTAGFLGQTATWWPADAPESRQRIASAERWQQLPADFISIGSHTLTHPYLTTLSETAARRELCESRTMLQDVLERKIRTLSFPYGDFNSEVVNWCRDAGYESVFTSLPGYAFRNENEFISGRVNVEPTDWPIEFRLKLLGAYRWLPFAIFLKRWILSCIRNI
jgi:peptidoglycan/xylan/chitin deacetylase (PgdA/CDA1 family)